MSEELWDRISAIDVRFAELEGRINMQQQALNTIEKTLMENREERQHFHNETKAALVKIADSVSAINDKVTEAHGMAKFGKWIVGTLIALGVPAAMFAWYSHGGGK